MDDLKNYELSDLFDLRGTYRRRILSVKNINEFSLLQLDYQSLRVIYFLQPAVH